MIIKGRLRQIADLVPEGSVILDVGADHAKLAIFLSKSGKMKKVYASEFRAGPFENLLANIASSEESVACYQADGLNDLPNDVNVVIIAGMGGKLISSIISKLDLLNTKPMLILAPQSNFSSVRSALCSLHYIIEEEFYIKEKNSVYPLIRAIYSDGVTLSFAEDEFEFGSMPLRKQDPVLLLEIKKKLKSLSQIDGYESLEVYKHLKGVERRWFQKN